MTQNRIKKVITNLISLSTTQWATFILLIIFGTFFGSYYVAKYWAISPLWGLLLGFGIGLLAFWLVVSLQNWFGNLAFHFHMGHAARWSRRERLESDLSIVRNFKIQKKYIEALNLVNKIIDQDPEFAEALLLKSQIVYEGFQNLEAAKKNLRRVMELVPDKNATHHRWALALYNELKENT
ncbi:MAG: hypothetical protein PVI06_02640 [Desulfobacterales bacterium]|jgi:tetratricopeptide (TPR) repeat protein